MRKIVLSVLFLSIAVCFASARLGETEEELTNRYGSAIEISTHAGLRTLSFSFGDFLVQARLRDGRCVFEYAALRKKDAELSDDVALALATKIGGSTNWVLIDSSAWQKTYGAKNSALFVQVNTEPGRPQSVMVTTTFELKRSNDNNPSSSVTTGF